MSKKSPYANLHRQLADAATQALAPTPSAKTLLAKRKLKEALEQLDLEAADEELSKMRDQLNFRFALELHVRLGFLQQAGFSREEAMQLLCARESAS